jgi:hypothetical protein
VSNVIRLSSARVQARDGLEESLIAEPSLFGPEGLSVPDPHGESPSSPKREEPMLDQLNRRDRLRLVEFVCSFAWADLEIRPEERVFISRLIRRLELDEDEDLRVQQWLDRPPGLDDLDPTSIPPAHRRFFGEAIEGLISADGEVSEEERETFEIFKQLLVD